MRKVIIIGECTLDLLFPSDRATDSVQVTAKPGGRMLNAAAMLGNCGYDVTYVSECASDPTGDMLVAYLERHGVNTKSIDRYSDGITPLNLRFAPEEELVFSRSYPKEKFDFVWPRIDSDDIVVFGAYFSLIDRVRTHIVELLNHAKERKAIIVYVPGLTPAPKSGITKMMPDILENLEMADVVITRSSDLRTIFNEADSAKCYERHIKFYSDNYIHIDSEDSSVKLHHKDVLFSASKKELKEDLSTNAGAIAGAVAALISKDVTLENLPTLGNEEMQYIVDTIAGCAYNKKLDKGCKR
ncbi:MAG: carbohydrate kinase family protein [Paramuribaculum sp.]|nr:carbohydrate kinase family protein [Paramuribaculum sp.]